MTGPAADGLRAAATPEQGSGPSVGGNGGSDGGAAQTGEGGAAQTGEDGADRTADGGGDTGHVGHERLDIEVPSVVVE